MDEYILDLSNMLLGVDDETLLLKNVTACLYALSVVRETPPGETLVDLSDMVPGKEEWENEFLLFFDKPESEGV